MANEWISKAMGNIIREKPVSVVSADFTDDVPFFIRANTGGVITYVPWNNEDNETVTKTLTASAIFNDPVVCRKILKQVVTSPATSYASGIYVGYGV
jgi:hypothetical protein